MEEFKASGKTVLFVSHTLEQIKRAAKAVWIDHGEMRMFDEVTHVIDMYESEMLKKIRWNSLEKEIRRPSWKWMPIWEKLSRQLCNETHTPFGDFII